MNIELIHGDCEQKLKELPDNSVDSIVTDPPYELGFMGKSWDSTGIANNVAMWREALRVLKPGGHLLAFSGTRTYHRMASAIEDAGFEVRDMIEWVYSTGFPKSLNVHKALKKKCECGNMEAYEQGTKQNTQHDLRPMSESDLSKEIPDCEASGEVLQSSVSEQSTHSPVLRKEPQEGGEWGTERILEGGTDAQKTEGQLQGSDISEMSEGVSTDGEERRLHNATQVSDGSTPEQTIDEKGSSASHRPQSEKQQDREPCAFCKQFGTQATRTLGIGTALKPAHEPICMARKPLGQQELDIAKNICYNIIEKGFITNSKIIWRINNVKSAEKQKTKQSSTPTQQQKMVVVSAEFVETKENESVGKKIQKLIENICESTVKKTAKKQTKELQNTTEQIEKEYSNLIKPIKENEKRTQSKNMGVNVSAVEKQTLSSLPLTTLEVEEDSTEKKSKMETSMSSLKSTDTQKTDTDYSAQTATSQWVCMDIVRTLKVSFEGKEYDFIELSDGSLVWNENLEPYRKQQKLNVAENVLKYGTGGINIDESRVSGEYKWRASDSKEKGDIFKEGSFGEQSPLGRFPANLIHDNSEEVRECFPETKTGNLNKVNTGIWGKCGERTEINHKGTEGNASRFFKSIIYQAKSSKRDRNSGLDGTLTVKYNSGVCKEENMVAVQLLQRVISEQELVSFNIDESGENIMAQCHKDSLFTTLTKTSKIIELKTLHSLMRSLTSEYIAVANSEMESGGNPVESVESLRRWLLDITHGKMESAHGVSLVALQMLSLINVEENWKPMTNIHSTVKPTALMSYLIKMVTPKGGTVLDPFMGSGSTGKAAKDGGFNFIGIEREAEYIEIARSRIEQVENRLF